MGNEFKFTVPLKLGGGDVVMRQMDVGQLDDILAREMAASKDAGAMAFVKSQTASVQAGIVSFRGDPWPTGTEGEKRWRQLDPKVKALFIRAYNALHTLEESDGEDFLKTMAPA